MDEIKCNLKEWCYFQYGSTDNLCAFGGACDDKGAAPNTERGKCSTDTTDKPIHEAQ